MARRFRPTMRPLLRRPAVGRAATERDRHVNRPAELAPGYEIRILFVFDPWQQIVLLVAGDKAGDWRGWYRKAIPRAEQLYAEHLEAMGNREEGG